jgi:hypothetical protein
MKGTVSSHQYTSHCTMWWSLHHGMIYQHEDATVAVCPVSAIPLHHSPSTCLSCPRRSGLLAANVPLFEARGENVDYQKGYSRWDMYQPNVQCPPGRPLSRVGNAEVRPGLLACRPGLASGLEGHAHSAIVLLLASPTPTLLRAAPESVSTGSE